MTPQMRPYTPSLYQPDSFGRYRKYPHFTSTPIPGAGYRVGELFWGEQELNLDGSRQPQPYGNYSMVPLRGLGQTLQLTPDMLRASIRPGGLTLSTQRSATIPPPAPPAPESGVFDVASEIAQASAAAEAAAQAAASQADGGSWFTQKVGPVPYWAIGLAGIAVLGGGGYLLYRRRKMRTNRRRRSRRAR